MGKKEYVPNISMLACFLAQSTPALKYSFTEVGGRYLCCLVIMEWFYNQSIWFHRTHSNDGQEHRQRKKFTTFMELVLLHTSVKHHTFTPAPFPQRCLGLHSDRIRSCGENASPPIHFNVGNAFWLQRWCRKTKPAAALWRKSWHRINFWRNITRRHTVVDNHESLRSDWLVNSIYNNPITYFESPQECHTASHFHKCSSSAKP